MKKNKLIITLLVLVLALGGIFSYRHFNHQKKIQTRQEDNFTRLIQMAKTNPRSGLPQMARALKKYYTQNKSYPSNLRSLFPEYMESKAFIEEIDWVYRPYDRSFYLAKKVNQEGNIQVASIDHSLRMKVGGEIMLAVAGQLDSPKSTLKPRVSQTNSEKEMKASAPSRIPDKTDADRNFEAMLAMQKEFGRLRGFAIPKDYSGFDENNMISASSMDKIKAISDNLPKIKNKFISETCFIWLDKNGYLNFSNVQYEDQSDLGYVYVEDKWQKPQG